MRTFLAVLLLATALSGCMSDAGNDGTDDEPSFGPTSDRWHLDAVWGAGVDPVEFDFIDRSEPHAELHDHNNRSHHTGLSTPNFHLLGHDNLPTRFHGQSSGGYFCGGAATQTRDDGRVISVVHSFTTEVGILVVDVTDPNNPFYIGEMVLPNNRVYDATATEDGDYAIVSVGPITSRAHYLEQLPGGDPTPDASARQEEASAPLIIQFTNFCTGEETQHETVDSFGPGTLLVDLSDPEHPTVADFEGGPALGPHSVSSTLIDGTNYVASSVTNLLYENSYFQFFTVEETDAGAQLLPHGEYSASYAQGEADYAQENPPEPKPDPEDPGGTADQSSGYVTDPAGSFYQGHVDATIYQHPVTGQILAGLANWMGGMITVDISTPGVTLPVSTWGNVDDAAINFGGFAHSVVPMRDQTGDRFYVLTGQEVISSLTDGDISRSTGQITVVDMTDPAAPEAVARWTLPMEIKWDSGPGYDWLAQFSTHYFTNIGDTLFVAMYHGGLWAVDMSEDQWPELPSLGVFIPADPLEQELPTYFVEYSPVVMDVFPLADGNLLVYDGDSGAYVLDFSKDSDVPVIDPWTKDAWIGA